MKLAVYKFLYKVTKNRKWLIKYLDILDEGIRYDIEVAHIVCR